MNMRRKTDRRKAPLHDLLGQLDIAFVIDTTGSMQPYIDEAKHYAADIAERVAKDNQLNIRYAVVAYRDHPPQDNTYVTKIYPFGDAQDLRTALTHLNAMGGGDRPEAVYDGVEAAISLTWRNKADRLIYLIGDSPPHGMHGQFSDGFPQGCPCGLTSAGLSVRLRSNGIELNGFSIENATDTTAAFELLAHATGGTVAVGNHPRMMSSSYGSTMTSHSDSVSDTRVIANCMTTYGLNYEDAAAKLGWSTDKSTLVGTYMTRRGLKT